MHKHTVLRAVAPAPTRENRPTVKMADGQLRSLLVAEAPPTPRSAPTPSASASPQRTLAHTKRR
ncbi:MAG: hypothetical protein NT062_13645 [Proteobacteria bacterium]|nr:hypothetical protein [Pseudomonadota bacterium]